jgi:hypothetical protein
MSKVLSILAIGLAVVSCKSKSDKPSPAAVTSSLTEDLSPVDSASAIPLAPKQEPWSPKFCEPAPETEAGNNDLTVSGTCAFKQHVLASCRARGDDYYSIVRRKMVDGHELEIYLNLEFYTGPGTYEKKVEIIALMRRGLSLYRWSNMSTTATALLEGDEKETPTVVKLVPTELKPEPGTMTTGTITLEGTIRCVAMPLPR